RRVARRRPDPARPVFVPGPRRLRFPRGEEVRRCRCVRGNARAVFGVLPAGGRYARRGAAAASCPDSVAAAARDGALESSPRRSASPAPPAWYGTSILGLPVAPRTYPIFAAAL